MTSMVLAFFVKDFPGVQGDVFSPNLLNTRMSYGIFGLNFK